jgi:23S rRNA G2069 N7-methylase RlmK/C1962 C5-methylase RlmI
VWKTTPSRLKQDGWDVKENAPAVEEVSNEVVVTRESGISYNTFPFQDGQKTGVYCDQRENKSLLTPLCENKRVLDLCCYHGGFALNAKLLGGAAHCTGVDSSQDAIDISEKNVALNGIEEGVEFVKEDIANFMKRASEEETEWDVIVLDPPKLAPSVSGLDRASRKYHSLNRDALKLINSKEGGLLLTCTCSAAMTQKDGGQYFLQTVQQAAISAGRQVTLLRTTGAAPCHTQSPASYPAGAYLTAALFHVAPTDL